jgi:NADPH-dependent 2,4-dienoyl-CoA reductase/sulfur reductase-like enzyme
LTRAQEGTAVTRREEFQSFAKRLSAANSVVIVGGGPIGVELAGEIVQDFPSKRVTVIESSRDILRGTRFGPEPYRLGRRLLRVLIKLAAPVVIPAKEAELRVFAGSDLNWTTVRPPPITSGRGHLQHKPIRATDL